MTTELTALALTGLIHAALYLALMIIARRHVPHSVLYGTRDEDVSPYLKGITGRLHRCLNNSGEALIFFTPAVVILALTDQSTPVTQICAGLFLGARAIYVVTYLKGMIPARSLIWLAGFLATFALYIAALVPWF
ncbi:MULTISPECIES: MAPEG family protein [Halocynthiibacter]|uniref:MAPEG family protein n=1 Tax=Halocynthiibacter halioticoli TaxID=2986804 RepID=A0AAE3LQJ4_9RHOB|nr:MULTISPECIES: MAPEG family protein [Halocynthiibacter]MCV6823589.1 MAPEG family protein [Halocynthiibacter halioticoli]MCW4056590.1 MAPEG family protein [Halocynthiibacter sp. SDUM655004]MDE0590393.1 MAPEG family protein [Halocynthiibacter sp. C4]